MENIIEEIVKLKKQKNAIILAHYYQEGEIQEIADFIGDSLELSKKAATTDSDIIVFCGVHFMAEVAKILNPTKKVLLPDLEAGCSLAESCPADKFREFKKNYPDHITVMYINCSAETKAESDIICTSSNAEKIVSSIPKEQKIIFGPDKNLGRYIAKKTGRDLVLWDGACIVHEHFNEKKILKQMEEYPEAKLISHPESPEAVLLLSHFIGSTSKLLEFVKNDNGKEYIIATEPGIIHQMKKFCPDKKFIPAAMDETCSCNNCPYMKLNTLEKVYQCLLNETPEINMDEELRVKALKPIQRMLELS
ncbi:MAG TPA: quinolinate synthase NadA [Ignavibacteriales bacterium]|nr:quinolinate synthase NadA [Ignavibacteriales bacterium]HOL81190.1 quinolinate synthase NadA [Ignavibacteriales bacterium]HOM65293.1 quinolinate synthase NadA [Ignavibacteriales bacterium]HPD68119.1 quinolinate synthase NadA [Ignavibacteriales bacterium]HPP33454.1 quinolinate synthase NadA [Ignavibacteriales bacterium]